jgi:hypothetical protein
VPPEGPARGWRVAGRVSEGVSVFVGGAREAENVGCFACRASLTLMPIAHADRAPLVATAHASAHTARAPRPVFPGFLQLPDTL